MCYCVAGQINEAKKMANTWFALDDAEKPMDGRYISSKVKDGEINEADIFG